MGLVEEFKGYRHTVASIREAIQSESNGIATIHYIIAPIISELVGLRTYREGRKTYSPKEIILLPKEALRKSKI